MRIDGFDDSYLNRLYPNSFLSTDNVQTVLTDKGSTHDSDSKTGKESAWDAVVKTPRKNADIGNVKVSLGNRDDSLVGLSNLGGIQSSVMRKAVSDMQKDSILHEYQYFVGSGAINNRSESDSTRIVMNDEDGLVIQR
ncbi:hypothetical protein [Butyrivibrio sp. AE3004]|uniref:hypothetical protein n=1 Tax=Butyrivibrio sp. AE3004 TaxID=1506994 RepID=UPI000493EB90|nr:hypothetical protein [Butyrivibrio sp. AE3004]